MFKKGDRVEAVEELILNSDFKEAVEYTSPLLTMGVLTVKSILDRSRRSQWIQFLEDDRVHHCSDCFRLVEEINVPTGKLKILDKGYNFIVESWDENFKNRRKIICTIDSKEEALRTKKILELFNTEEELDWETIFDTVKRNPRIFSDIKNPMDPDEVLNCVDNLAERFTGRGEKHIFRRFGYFDVIYCEEDVYK